MIMMADPSTKALWKLCASSTYILAKLQKQTYIDNSLQFPAKTPYAVKHQQLVFLRFLNYD